MVRMTPAASIVAGKSQTMRQGHCADDQDKVESACLSDNLRVDTAGYGTGSELHDPTPPLN